MEARSKEAILSKTHYGIGIYAHILRLYYPGDTVLSLSGRTCSPTKNPFNADKSTLNIFIENKIKDLLEGKIDVNGFIEAMTGEGQEILDAMYQ